MIFQAISINNYQMFLSIEKENVIIDCHWIEKYAVEDKKTKMKGSN